MRPLGSMTPPKKKPSQRKRDSQKRRVAECDRLFSLIVRSRGRCEIDGCGSTDWLQCAHGFSRRYRAVRWDERNALCACRAHHVYFTHRPLEWDEFLVTRWGEDLYAELRSLALNGPNPDAATELLRLKSVLSELEAA